MNKPYDSEIIKAMAAHSDEGAARATGWKWDWLRRQKVENITELDVSQNCAFCEIYNSKPNKRHSNCPLYKDSCGCHKSYHATIAAFRKQDQQAFTQNANDLYFLIRSIIDDFYKPKPEPKKEEVFYHTGQRFNHKEYGDFVLATLPHASGDVFFTKKDGSWLAPVMKWSGFYTEIPESVLRQHTEFENFTLIVDKK